MNWKKYRALGAETKRGEAYYVIGLDIGNDSSGIAFYNLAENAPEVIDLSGGYGKPSVPTVMQYIAENKEWVFGEYAMLNRGMGTEITLSGLVERLGRFDYIDVDHRSVSVSSVLALFIKEILGSVKNINPKAEIVGIVAAVPAYFSEQAHDEFQRAFKQAGYEKELIALVPDRECVLANHYRRVPEKVERALLLDFGSRDLRGGLYDVSPDSGAVLVTSMSSVFNDAVSTSKVNNDVNDMFEAFVLAQVKASGAGQIRQLREHVSAFTYQHKDMLFQKNISQKPIKLYFNFAYPPFQQTVDNAQMQGLLRPYISHFNRFIQDVLEKSLYEDDVRPTDIDTVLCVGGGFEMLWAKDAVSGLFSKSQVRFYKNPKMVTAEGAALVAARELGVGAVDASAELPHLSFVDKHQLTGDIGIVDSEFFGKTEKTVFLPLVERNSFWWQKHPSKLILVNRAVDGEIVLNLEERGVGGEGRSLGRVILDDLPSRPKGVTRLEVGIKFMSNKELTVSVCDKGFGDLFPRVEYERAVELTLG